METKVLKNPNDAILLQAANSEAKAKLMDELNKQIQELTQANTKKQNLNLQLELEAENLKKSNEKPKTESSSSGPDEEEEEDEEKPICKFCGSDEHDSHCPHLEPT